MEVTCSKCKKVYNIDPVKIPKGKKTAKCKICGGSVRLDIAEKEEELEEKKCKKCGYVRTISDLVPDWQCPNCGVAYDKVSKNIVNDAKELKNKNNPPVPPSKTPQTDSIITNKPTLKPAKKLQEKSTALAIGLNIVLPGLGYIYMGRIIIGILCSFLIIAIYLNTAILIILPVWFSMNAIMLIDMFILGSKRKKEIEKQNTMPCPECAELIKKEAKKCRFCGSILK
jgi:hypothetical protein